MLGIGWGFGETDLGPGRSFASSVRNKTRPFQIFSNSSGMYFLIPITAHRKGLREQWEASRYRHPDVMQVGQCWFIDGEENVCEANVTCDVQRCRRDASTPFLFQLTLK